MAIRNKLRAAIEGLSDPVIDVIQGNEVSDEVQEELEQALRDAGAELSSAEVSTETQQQELVEKIQNSVKLYVITPSNYDPRLFSDIIEDAQNSGQKVVVSLVDADNYPEESEGALDELRSQMQSVGVTITDTLQETATTLVESNGKTKEEMAENNAGTPVDETA